MSETKITFVIPTWNDAAKLEDLLQYLAATHPDEEVIVSDGGSSDGTIEMAERLGAGVVHNRQATRGPQLNAGARVARGGLLCFLHADSIPPKNSGELIRHALSDPSVMGGGFRIQYDTRHPALSLLGRLSFLKWRTAYFGDQGFFCRAKDFGTVGGYPSWPLFEDVGLALALARRGPLSRPDGTTIASARRFVLSGPWRQLALNASLCVLFHLGVSPQRLSRIYDSSTTRETEPARGQTQPAKIPLPYSHDRLDTQD